MTYREYLESGQWHGLDALNATEAANVVSGNWSKRAMFVLYNAWSAAYDPEMGDTLAEILCKPNTPAKWRNEFWERMATVPVDFVSGMGRMRRSNPVPVALRCTWKDCGHEWKPKDILRTRRCERCGREFLKMVFG